MANNGSYKAGSVELVPYIDDYEVYIDSYGVPFLDGDQKLSDIVYKAELPHQCDAWVIGGKEEIKQLISDLQKLLDKM